MGFFKDLTNEKFGRWTVLEISERRKNNGKVDIYWKCRCDCGNIKSVKGENLKSGVSKSCGCINAERNYKNNIVHGMKGTRIYRIWNGMKNRCTNQNDSNYFMYGGRNITICDEWLNNFVSFYNWAIKNGYKDNLSIDRIDVNGNYCPENCRWVDCKIQANNRRSNHIVTYKGISKTVAEWENELGFKKDILTSRLANGWEVEKAIETPYKQRNFNKEYGYYSNLKNEIVCINGEKKTIEEWCLVKNLKINTIIKRMSRGMSGYEALTKPLANIGRWKTKNE